MKKRALLSWLLVFAIALSLFTVPAFAEGSDPVTRAQTAAADAEAAATAAMAAATEADTVAAEAEAIECSDMSAAEAARAEATKAMDAATAARAAADKAAEYRDNAVSADAEGNADAADNWATAAEASCTVAQSQQSTAESKLATVKVYLETQKTIASVEDSEKAALEAAKHSASMELLALAAEEGHGAPYTDITDAAQAAIDAAATQEEVEQILQEARDAVAARKVCPAAVFTDVDTARYYHEAVDYMVAAGYMNGVSAGLFDVDGSLQRGQLVTILYRVTGSPDVSEYDMPFEDVADGRYYTDAVKWAAANGIVTGVTTTTFCPEAPISREQIVTILFRYAGAEAPETTPDTLIDLDQVGNYAKPAVAWAVQEGIITGIQTEAGLEFQPKGNATRAQCATILARFLNK